MIVFLFRLIEYNYAIITIFLIKIEKYFKNKINFKSCYFRKIFLIIEWSILFANELECILDTMYYPLLLNCVKAYSFHILYFFYL